MDMGRPSSVVVYPAALWSGGAQRWYSLSGSVRSQPTMSILPIGASMVAVKAACERILPVSTVRSGVVVVSVIAGLRRLLLLVL